MDTTFGQDEADTTIIPYVPDGAISGKGVITCSVIKLMLVLLVYWGVSGGPQCKVKMEHYGTVLCNLLAKATSDQTTLLFQGTY